MDEQEENLPDWFRGDVTDEELSADLGDLTDAERRCVLRSRVTMLAIAALAGEAYGEAATQEQVDGLNGILGAVSQIEEERADWKHWAKEGVEQHKTLIAMAAAYLEAKDAYAAAPAMIEERARAVRDEAEDGLRAMVALWQTALANEEAAVAAAVPS